MGSRPHLRVHTLPLPKPSNAGGRPPTKAKQAGNKTPRKATHKAQQPSPRPEPTSEEVEAKKQARRQYDQKRAQTSERKDIQRRVAQARRDEARRLGLCKRLPEPGDNEPIPGAKNAPRSAGRADGRPRKELTSRKSRPPDRPRSSDNTGPGLGPTVPGRGRGKPGRFACQRTQGGRRTGNACDCPVLGDVGDVRGNPPFFICPPASTSPRRTMGEEHAHKPLETKLKPRWNLHLRGDEDWIGRHGEALPPVPGGRSGAAD